MKLDPIEDAIAAIANGECIIVVDDADRENEGDLVMAASKASKESMAFVIKAGGLVCAPITASEAKRLKLEPMARENDAPLATAFTVSVDYKEGLTTGINANERASTVRALANGNVGAEDFVRPGHIFPLVAKDGGVLMRSGHTEAAVDLARMAGEPPAGLICEILGPDGDALMGDGLMGYAQENNLKVVSIADLIAYRQQREKLVTREATFELMTEIGPAEAHVYSTPFDEAHHIALVYGEVAGRTGALTRLHRQTPIEDVFGGADTAINRSMAAIKKAGHGVIVYLREGAVGVTAQRPEWEEGEGGASSATRMEAWREVGLGAQILRDLGVRSISLLASQERDYVGLSGFGVEITGTTILE